MINQIFCKQNGCEVHSLYFVIPSLTISIQCLKPTNHLPIVPHISLVQLMRDQLPIEFPPGQVILWQNLHFSLPFHKHLCCIGWLFPTIFCVVWHSVVSHVPCNYQHCTVRHVPSPPPPRIMLPLRWRQYVLLKYWNIQPLHGSETQR